MKTKLLKIVRKRYSITMIEKIGYDTPYYIQHFSLKNPLPLYEVIDKRDRYRISDKVFNNYAEAYQNLLQRIYCHYSHTSKKRKSVQLKLWY